MVICFTFTFLQNSLLYSFEVHVCQEVCLLICLMNPKGLQTYKTTSNAQHYYLAGQFYIFYVHF